MKKLKPIQYLALLVMLLISDACKKDPLPRSENPSDVTMFLVSAGTDTAITKPASSVLLKGTTSLILFDIQTKKWTKKSGPANDTIESPNEFVTTVRNLQVGVYEYEFTVTSKKGIIKSDVCKIIVNSAPPPPPPPPGNRPPSAYGGYDLIIQLPKDTGYLYGGGHDPDNNIATIQWTKIAGPSSVNIVRPDSIFSRITNLERGVYKFEIKVVDSLGLTARDTNTVIVGELPPNPQEIILTNQGWSCHWDCYIQIDRLYDNIPPDMFFKIFIKRDNSSNWLEVVPGDEMIQSSIYGYSLRKGTLLIHQIFHTGFDISDTPDIKIVY
jgi:hypothetical protein